MNAYDNFIETFCNSAPTGFDGSDGFFLNGLGYSMLALYKRRLFETTEMLLKDIARAANIGWSCFKKSGAKSNGAKIPAATGMSTML